MADDAAMAQANFRSAIAVVTAFDEAAVRGASGDATIVNELEKLVAPFIETAADQGALIVGLAHLALRLANELSRETDEEVPAILRRLALEIENGPPLPS